MSSTKRQREYLPWSNNRRSHLQTRFPNCKTGFKIDDDFWSREEFVTFTISSHRTWETSITEFESRVAILYFNSLS